MKNKNETLLLFTLNYPFGIGEEFIENEIKEASKHFDTIIIVPNNSKGRIRTTPNNVEVVNLENIKQNKNYKNKNFIKFLKLFIEELTIQDKQNLYRVKAIKVFWNYYKEQLDKFIFIKELIKKLINDNKKIFLYDFWSTNNALAISMIKQQYPSIKYIACTHNFDLYDFRWKCPIPFRGLMMKEIDRIFPDSKYGIKYLKNKIPKKYHSKIEVAYMGTPDFGLAPIPYNNNNIIIISTSRCISLKRVDWIIKALSKLEKKNIEFKWVHFGDGIICKELQQQANKLLEKKSFEFKGWVEFDKLIEFYKTTPIDVFLHTSKAEGLPVSLMIASSFGIPIVAVDSMGIPEIVNKKTGYLLPSNCKIEDISNAVEVVVNKFSKSKEARESIRKHTIQNFSLLNYEKFYKKIIKL